MKKFLSLIGVVSLSATAITGLSSTIEYNATHLNQEEPPKILNNGEMKLDWNDISITLNNNFESLQEEKKIQNFSEIRNNTNEGLTEEALNKVQEIAAGYINNFEKNDASFNETFDTLKNNSPEFKEIYEEQFQDNINNFDLEEKKMDQKTNFLSSFFSNNIILEKKDILKLLEESEKVVINLNLIEKASLSITIAASIAAVSFWAASWWFGITIPWAISATAISVSAGVVLAIVSDQRAKIGNEIVITKKRMNHYKDSIKMIISSFKIIKNTIKIIKNGYTVNAAISSINSWSFKPAIAYVGLLWAGAKFIDTLGSFISYYF